MQSEDSPSAVAEPSKRLHPMCPRCGDGDCCSADVQGTCMGGCNDSGSHAMTQDGTVGDFIGFAQLRETNVTRCEEAFHLIDDWTPAEWLMAATGELGSAASLLKKLRRGEPVEITDIAYELADTVIYLDLLAARLGVDLGAAVREKFNIVSERVGSEVRL